MREILGITRLEGLTRRQQIRIKIRQDAFVDTPRLGRGPGEAAAPKSLGVSLRPGGSRRSFHKAELKVPDPNPALTPTPNLLPTLTAGAGGRLRLGVKYKGAGTRLRIARCE